MTFLSKFAPGKDAQDAKTIFAKMVTKRKNRIDKTSLKWYNIFMHCDGLGNFFLKNVTEYVPGTMPENTEKG